jgi:hypothetical protein
MNIDFCWYPKNCGRLGAPVVVIEHENIEQNLLEDFWKVSQLAAPLRVCIGYATTAAGIERLSRQALESSEHERWPCPEYSEDLLILGDYEVCAFHAWTRAGTSGWKGLPRK